MGPVFDYRGLRLLMGMIAVSLPIVVSVLACAPLTSVSASYHTDARDIFVGLLFVVGSFLFAYNGHSLTESIASKAASLAAVCVASFPTACDGCPTGIDSVVHHIAATALFLILAYFCFIPFRKDLKNAAGRRARRNWIYLVCGWTMIVCMAVIAIAKTALPEAEQIRWRFTYYGEAVALMAFGVAWIASGKFFRLFADEDELYYPFRR